MPYSQDSDDVECGIEKNGGFLSRLARYCRPFLSMRTAIARNTLDYDPRLMLLTIPGYCEGWFKPGKVFSQESDICGK